VTVAEVRALCNGGGTDVVFELSGQVESVEMGFELLRKGGLYVRAVWLHHTRAVKPICIVFEMKRRKIIA
jgi:threonine dehydrogenase-like Zn-dependent dehydrogenase